MKAWMLILVLIILGSTLWAGTPISFEVVVTDSSYLADSLGMCTVFDTLIPDTLMLDSVTVYEKVNGQNITLVNYGPTKVASSLMFFWRTPKSGAHILCVAAWWQGFKGCESCIEMPSWTNPPQLIIKE